MKKGFFRKERPFFAIKKVYIWKMNFIMKKYCLVILSLLPLLSIAQSNYKSGYVVTLKGDTLRGYINYKEWGRNPKDIDFKARLDSKARLFGVQEIKYFQIGDMVSYQLYSINISLNPIDISSPPSVTDTASLNDTVFLKILQKGANVSLYGYRDGIKNRFYIKDNSLNVPVELLYGVYESYGDANSNSVVTKNTFRDQLNQIAGKYKPGADKLAAQIQQAGYIEDDLISIAAEINGNAAAWGILKSAGSPPVRFFAGGAFISSSLKYSSGGPYYGASPATSNSPKVSIGVDAITDPDVGHLLFRVELAYTVNNFSVNAQPNPLYNIAEPT